MQIRVNREGVDFSFIGEPGKKDIRGRHIGICKGDGNTVYRIITAAFGKIFIKINQNGLIQADGIRVSREKSFVGIAGALVYFRNGGTGCHCPVQDGGTLRKFMCLKK